MLRHERLSAILELVAQRGSLSVEDLVDSFTVSAATARRDLDDLAGQQLITRTRGGAVAHTVTYDLPLRYKSSRSPDQKRRIAAAASALPETGDVVGLNGGTTNTEVARSLATRADLNGDAPIDARLAHRRHQRAQHRQRARRPPAAEGGRRRRGAAPAVLRAHRPVRARGARRRHHRPHVPRRRRAVGHARRRGGARGRGADQPDDGRALAPRGRGGRQLQAGAARVLHHLRRRARRHADHRQGGADRSSSRRSATLGMDVRQV